MDLWQYGTDSLCMEATRVLRMRQVSCADLNDQKAALGNILRRQCVNSSPYESSLCCSDSVFVPRDSI